MHRATEGEVRLLGQPGPPGLPEVMREVGAIVEAPALHPGFTGRRNLEILARVAGVSEARVDEVLEIVGPGGPRQAPGQGLLAGDEAAAGHRGGAAEGPAAADPGRAGERAGPGRHPRGPRADPPAGQPRAGPSSCRATSSTRSSRCATAVAILSRGQAGRGGPGQELLAERQGPGVPGHDRRRSGPRPRRRCVRRGSRSAATATTCWSPPRTRRTPRRSRGPSPTPAIYLTGLQARGGHARGRVPGADRRGTARVIRLLARRAAPPAEPPGTWLLLVPDPRADAVILIGLFFDPARGPPATISTRRAGQYEATVEHCARSLRTAVGVRAPASRTSTTTAVQPRAGPDIRSRSRGCWSWRSSWAATFVGLGVAPRARWATCCCGSPGACGSCWRRRPRFRRDGGRRLRRAVAAAPRRAVRGGGDRTRRRPAPPGSWPSCRDRSAGCAPGRRPAAARRRGCASLTRSTAASVGRRSGVPRRCCERFLAVLKPAWRPWLAGDLASAVLLGRVRRDIVPEAPVERDRQAGSRVGSKLTRRWGVARCVLGHGVSRWRSYPGSCRTAGDGT